MGSLGVSPYGTMTGSGDVGRGEHGNKSRVESGGIFDPALSKHLLSQVLFEVPQQEAHGGTISQPEASPLRSFSAGFDAGRHQVAPHNLHSVTFLYLCA